MTRIITNILSKNNYINYYEVANKFGKIYPNIIYNLPRIIHDDYIEFDECAFIYENTNIDYISYYIINNEFNWEAYSLRLLYFAPQYFDPNKFNWKILSSDLALAVPEYFDPNRYNWNKSTTTIIQEVPFLYTI